jgi:hypothetical protein
MCKTMAYKKEIWSGVSKTPKRVLAIPWFSKLQSSLHPNTVMVFKTKVFHKTMTFF